LRFARRIGKLLPRIIDSVGAVWVRINSDSDELNFATSSRNATSTRDAPWRRLKQDRKHHVGHDGQEWVPR
jgi:hypothetical protein